MKKRVFILLALVIAGFSCSADQPPGRELFSTGCSITPKIVFYNASLSGRFGDELVAGYRGRYLLEYHLSGVEPGANYSIGHWVAVVCNGKFVSNSSLTAESKTVDNITTRVLDLGFDVPNEIGDCYMEYLIYGVDGGDEKCGGKNAPNSWCYCPVGSFPTTPLETPISPIFTESSYYQHKNNQKMVERGDDEREQIFFLRNQSIEQLQNIRQQTMATILLAVATFIMAFGTVWLAWETYKSGKQNRA